MIIIFNSSRKPILTFAISSIIIISGCQIRDTNEGNLETEKNPIARKIGTLSNYWQFQLDVRDIGEKEGWFSEDYDRGKWAVVNVPQAWDCYEEALWAYEGIGWYATTIQPTDFIKEEKVEIHFDRVMYHTQLWLNGDYLGENIGGYLPFSFDITNDLNPDQKNKLVLRVDNRPRIEWLPASEQIEWLQYGGILGPVRLISKSHAYIDDLCVRTYPNKDSSRVSLHVVIANETDQAIHGELNISISRDNEIAAKELKVQCQSYGKSEIEADFYIQNAEIWSPENPVLYYANIDLIQDGNTIDDLSDHFGIREISVNGTSILLNGHPLVIKGSHRYDSYDRYGPTPPEELVRKDLELMKSVGINTIRVHYPASNEFLNLLDEYGLMMMEEIPLNWWGLKWEGMKSIGGEAGQSLDILDQAKKTLTTMITRDKNHPSVILWSMANESRTDNEIGITVMRELLKLAKSMDPTRLTTFVAGGDPRGHPGFDSADVVCFNEYFICNHISQIDTVVYQRLSKDLELYRSFFDNKPIVMSEFGRQGIQGIHGDVFYTEEWQAAYIESVWKAIEGNPTISGGILWTWADYFHEPHFALHTSYGFYGVINANYGPFGVVTGDRKQKKSLGTLARMYGGILPDP